VSLEWARLGLMIEQVEVPEGFDVCPVLAW
jgi:hypothetical protein